MVYNNVNILKIIVPYQYRRQIFKLYKAILFNSSNKAKIKKSLNNIITNSRQLVKK